MTTTSFFTAKSRKQVIAKGTSRLRMLPFSISLGVLSVSLFWQIWFDISGVTVRLEDVLSLLLLGMFLAPLGLSGRLRYRRHLLNGLILVWVGVIIMGISVTMVGNYESTTQRNALINGIRLALAVGLFFVILNHPLAATRKLKIFVGTVLGFSLVTTTVALLQMGYWDGWLPISLPDVLVTLKEGASQTYGKEIFALFVGDTGAHTWSGALAFQALVVWLLIGYARHPLQKVGLLVYLLLLVVILFRVSTRNSILGLFVAIVGLALLKQQRDAMLKLLRIILVALCIIIGLLFLLYWAPDSFFVERIRQAIPRFEDGQLVISRQSNIYGRLDYWALAIEIFREHPITGSGFYTFQELSQLYTGQLIVHAHNSYFHTLAEFGIVGISSLSLLMIAITYYLLRIRRYTRTDFTLRFWWEFVAGAFLFLVFSSIFSNTFWVPSYIYPRMIALGILVSLVQDRKL